jgi:hypothetical protein
MMAQPPVRALNQDASGLLAPAKADEPSPALIASGRLRPATLAGPVPGPKGPIRTELDAGELLGRLRDNERY